MLAFLGFLTVIVMLALIMTKKASPLVALIAVPVVTGIISSFFRLTEVAEGEPTVVDVMQNIKNLGGYITGASGIGSVAATGVMFIFSILFFGILTDAGTFRPIINKVIGLVGTDPVKIALGTAVLAAIVHLDGSGAVTFLICVPALLPLYDAIGMRLGEGSGCPLAFQVLDAACAVINDMATFDEAGINDDYLDEIRRGDQFTP